MRSTGVNWKNLSGTLLDCRILDGLMEPRSLATQCRHCWMQSEAHVTHLKVSSSCIT